MFYVAVDIGCLECGESSEVLGIFTNKEKAEEVCEEHRVRQNDEWHGEHSFEVFEIAELDKVNRVEYKYEL